LFLARRLIIWGEVKTIKVLDGTLRVTETEVLRAKELLKNPFKKAHLYLKALGPGLITGASDDDPSGSARIPRWGPIRVGDTVDSLLAASDHDRRAGSLCRIGIVTNRGLAGVLQKHYRRNIVMGAVVLLIVANVANIGADIGAMAASLKMLVGSTFIWRPSFSQSS